MIIGITGGSGSGKSSVVAELEKDGYFVIDADEVARFVVEPKKPAYNEIKQYFSQSVFFEDGKLNRKKLGEIVFSDKTKLKKLNEITHKHIYDEIKKRIEENKNCDILIDAPLLKEGGLLELCDVVVAITAKKEERAKRIVARDKISYKTAMNRINSQANDDTYDAYCDLVLDNSGEKTIEEIKDGIIRFIKK